MVPKLKQLTASGAVKATGGYVFGVYLTGGSDAAQADLRDGGAAGTIVLTVTAGAGVTAPVVIAPRAVLSTGIYVTLAGTGPKCSVAYW